MHTKGGTQMTLIFCDWLTVIEVVEFRQGTDGSNSGQYKSQDTETPAYYCSLSIFGPRLIWPVCQVLQTANEGSALWRI